MIEMNGWREYRKPIEITPEAIAAALNSHAENWDQVNDPLFPQELREGGFCILIAPEGKPVETLLYMRDDVSVLTIHLRLKEGTQRSLSVNCYSFISQAEGIVSPKGEKGVIFTVEEKGEVLVMESGFLDSRMLELDTEDPNTKKNGLLSFFRRH